MLSSLRRWAIFHLGYRTHRYRVIRYVGIAQNRMRYGFCHTQVFYLLIGKYLVDLVNRAAGNTGAVESFDPFITRAGGEILIQRFMQRLTVL